MSSTVEARTSAATLLGSALAETGRILNPLHADDIPAWLTLYVACGITIQRMTASFPPITLAKIAIQVGKSLRYTLIYFLIAL
jgi:hypothetical protein